MSKKAREQKKAVKKAEKAAKAAKKEKVMTKKTTKVVTKRRKFIEVEMPIIRTKIELLGNTPGEVKGRTIKLDLTRQLKGKGVEAILKIKVENNKAVAYPIKIKLMPYFIKRMIRKRISYVEDSFEAPSQESLLKVKPFLITRKRVSRAVRKTLRNKARNWVEDYLAERKDSEIFNEILTNKLQKPLSLTLKKTYPLSLCEIRILEIKRPLSPEEVPKIKKAPEKLSKKEEPVLDQLKEIEEEKIKKAEEEIKKTQEKAAEKKTEESKEENEKIKNREKEEKKEDIIKEEKPKDKKKSSKKASVKPKSDNS